MNIFVQLLVLVLFVRGVNTFIFLLQSFLWLRRDFYDYKKGKFLKEAVYILIPVLREQKRITETLEYFISKFDDEKIHIITITTEKEFEKEIKCESTREIIEKFIKTDKRKNKIVNLHYSKKTGLVANQLNFAINSIADNNSYIAIYNADSRPNPQTIKVFNEELERHPNAKVFQQSALFLNNFDNINSNWIKRVFLQTAAIQQTRWTLVHELSALRRQSFSKNSFIRKYFNSHCVTHGLIINTGFLKSIGGFSDKTLTEDLFLGYLIKSKQQVIYPLRILENADSPRTIRGLWDQKYVWFWGPMKYLYYFRYIIKNRRILEIVDLKPPFFLMLQGLWSATSWLFSGIIILIAIVVILVTKDKLFSILTFFSILIYYPLQYMLIAYFFPFLFKASGSNHKKISIQYIFLIGLTTFPVIFFHSIPPFFSIASEIKSVIFNTPIFKPKTDDQL